MMSWVQKGAQTDFEVLSVIMMTIMCLPAQGHTDPEHNHLPAQGCLGYFSVESELHRVHRSGD